MEVVQSLSFWLESTRLARTVGESLPITAWLSAVHLIGFTLVMSGAVVWNLRATGLVLARIPAQSVARPSTFLLLAGLAISLPTGFALFAPRASSAILSGAFQLKMALLVAGAIFQLVFNRRVLSKSGFPERSLRVSGGLALMLWLSLALAACWFILFE